MPLRPETESIGGFLPEADLKRPIPESDGLGTAGKIAGGVALGAGMFLAPEITLPAMAVGGGASLFADSEGAAAAFRTENTIGSTLASKSYWFDGERDPSYDPWADIAGTPYEEYWDSFTTARSKPHADAIKADLDREAKDRRYLENQGAIGYAQGLAAGLFDPTILLPGGAIVRGAKGGVSAARTAGSVAAYGAGGAALTEGVLQATQQTRTWEESATAIAGATVLSGVLGAGLARRAGREIDAWGSAVEADLARPAPTPTGGERSSAGAPPSGATKPIVEAVAGASPRAMEVADAIRQTAEEILPADVRVQVVDTLGAPGDEGLFGLRGFYSPAIRAAESISMKKGTGEQFLKQITKAGGVRRDEIEWMGLEEFLADKKAATKDEVLDFMRAHQVDLDEKVLGEPVALTDAERGELDDLNARIATLEERFDQKYANDVAARSPERDQEWAEISALRLRQEALSDKEFGTGRDDVKFQANKVPGGENYRELLIRLPELGEPKALADLKKQLAPLKIQLAELETARRSANVDNREKYYEVRDLVSTLENDIYRLESNRGEEVPKYKSKHFEDQELVHLRVDDRTGTNGEKVLFINEVQSDLHQAGRRFGYGETAKADVRRQIEEKRARIDELDRESSAPGFRERSTHEQRIAIRTEADRLSAEIGDLSRRNPPPDAPFKGDLWLELALKRALLYAVENGYDAISWSRSDQIAKAVGAAPEKLALQYDQKIGKFLDRYTKKWGGDIQEPHGHSERLTSLNAEMEQLAAGASAPSFDPQTLPRIADRNRWYFLAEERLTEGNEPVFSSQHQTNPLLRVTPEMRSSIMEGQPFGLRQSPTGPIAEGRFDPQQLLITIAADALDPAKTLRHESIHALKQMGLFTPKQWKTLEAAAKKEGWLDTHNVRALYEDLYRDGGKDGRLSIREQVKEQLDEIFDEFAVRDIEELRRLKDELPADAKELRRLFKEQDRLEMRDVERHFGPDYEGSILGAPMSPEAEAVSARIQVLLEKYKTEDYEFVVNLSHDLRSRLAKAEKLHARMTRGGEKYSVRADDVATGTKGAPSGDSRLEAMLLEEAIAEQFSLWRQGAKQVNGALAEIFRQMQLFLDRLGNTLRGRGFQTAEDVFQAVRSGEVAARAPGSIAQEAARAAGTGAASSAGAAAVQGSDYRLKGALGLEKGLKRLSPALWLQNSPSRVSRQIIDELGETGTYRTDHADWYESARQGAEMGQYGSVESRVKTFQGQSLAEAFTAIDDGFTSYRSGSEKRRFADITKTSLSDFFLGSGGKLEFKQFREAVGRAMAEGDTHEIPEVAATAKKLRPIFDRYLKEAIKLGMLPEGVSPETAPSYVTRLYDRNRIIAERPEFKQVIVDWLAEVERANSRVRETLSRHVAELDRIESRAEKNEAKLAKREARLKEFERASEEVSRFNKFAYERATKRSEPIDALRQQIAGINDSIAGPLQRIAELTAEIRGQKETIPGLREVERQMQIVSRRSSEIKKGGGELIDDIDDASAISDGLEAFADSIADVLSRLRAEGRQLRAESDVAEQLKALEKERAKLSKRISPLRKRLRTLRDEMGGLEKRARPRAAETGAYQSRFRARGNKLADQISGRKADVESLRFGIENDRARAADLTKLVEEQVELYQGKTASEAQSAISARRAADAERAEPRTTPAKMLKPVRAAAEKIAAQEGKDAAELPGLADQIIDRILGTPEGRLPYDGPTVQAKSGFSGVDMDARGPLAARQFMIPDRMIEQWLERDIDVIMRAYVHTMAPDIELTKRFGSPDMVDKFKEVAEEYAKLADQPVVEKGKSRPKNRAERDKLSNQMDEDFRNIAAIRDRLRGTYAIPENPEAIMVRTARTALTLSYMSKLGGQVISAFTDPARFVMVHGLAATFSDGLIPLFSNFKQFRGAARELEKLHGAAELINDSRALRMADISDSWGANTKFERLVQSGGRNFGMVSLMAPWNAAMKQFASVLTLNRIMRNAVKRSEGKTLSRREQEFMAWSGISDGAARRMGVEFKTNGVKQNGLWLPNTNAWSDASRNVVDALSVALRKNVDTIIITPTAGELPKFHSRLWGKLLLQFKSFSISATQKMLIAGLQQRDMAALNGALLSLALGGLVYILKGEMAGKPAIVPKSIDDPNWGVFFGEAFDRSGLAGILSELNNISEKVTRGKIGLSALTGKPISRYASRNVTQSLAGPVFGLTEDVVDIAGAAASQLPWGDRGKPQPWVQRNTHSVRQIIPWQNLFYIRSTVDKAEAAINALFGIPERAPAR